ncbi:YgaP family membrane protein [Coraliomargarita parva]|uniref:YgaP family membrane protein n=1 Tax=Coraliomargarita parva TaxID=3014050 RepID=UPI0022B5E31D|nr:DUF2892 domain-containing protein [Coraliomargarita parva]
MNLDKAVMIFAGCVVLTSVALAFFISNWWLLLTVFAGCNMIQAAFTGFCPIVYLLRAFGIPAGCAFKGKNQADSE